MSKLDLKQLKRDLSPARRETKTPKSETNGVENETIPPVRATNGASHATESMFREEENWAPPGESIIALPAITDAALFMAEKLPPPPEIIKGLLHQGTKMVVGGGSKSFKTWIQLDAALSVANGVPWLNFETAKGRVLYVNFELHACFFQQRIHAVCEAKKIPKVLPKTLDVWNLRGHSAAHGIIVPQIVQRIKDEGYVLVVIDPIYKLYGNTDENSAGEVAALMNALERICVDTSAAVLFGAHFSKGNQSAKESIDRISGSGVFARDPDTILPFTTHEEENCFTVEPTLRNLPPCPPFVVRFKFPLMTVDDDLDPTKLREQTKGRKKECDAGKLLAAIRDNTASDPISAGDWAEKLGMNRTTLYGYLPELRSLGFIATAGEGTKAKKYITEKGVEFLNNLPTKQVSGS